MDTFSETIHRILQVKNKIILDIHMLIATGSSTLNPRQNNNTAM